MGLFIAAGLVLLYWILDKIEMYQGEKAYKEHQEDKKRRGLTYYE